MTHFPVMVIQRQGDPEGTAGLAEMLEPYDESRPVEPYWEEESAQFWARVALGVEHGAPNQAVDQLAQDPALVLQRLHERLGHDTVVREELSLRDGRIMRMTNRNPHAKWDFWRVGGRWPGVLRMKEGEEHRGELAELAWEFTGGGITTPMATKPDLTGRADRAPIGAVDLTRMRDEAVVSALEEWHRAKEVIQSNGGLPEDFRQCFSPGEKGFAEARQAYWEHPAIAGLRDAGLVGLMEFPHDRFGCTEDEFIALAWHAAVTAWATLSREGWREPGRVGWFAVCDATAASRLEYLRETSAMLDELAKYEPEATVTIVDCHI